MTPWTNVILAEAALITVPADGGWFAVPAKEGRSDVEVQVTISGATGSIDLKGRMSPDSDEVTLGTYTETGVASVARLPWMRAVVTAADAGTTARVELDRPCIPQ